MLDANLRMEDQRIWEKLEEEHRNQKQQRKVFHVQKEKLAVKGINGFRLTSLEKYVLDLQEHSGDIIIPITYSRDNALFLDSPNDKEICEKILKFRLADQMIYDPRLADLGIDELKYDEILNEIGKRITKYDKFDICDSLLFCPCMASVQCFCYLSCCELLGEVFCSKEDEYGDRFVFQDSFCNKVNDYSDLCDQIENDKELLRWIRDCFPVNTNIRFIRFPLRTRIALRALKRYEKNFDYPNETSSEFCSQTRYIPILCIKSSEIPILVDPIKWSLARFNTSPKPNEIPARVVEDV